MGGPVRLTWSAMSGGEFILFLFGGAFGIYGLGRWYWAMFSGGPRLARRSSPALLLMPPVCLAVLVAILRLFADRYVRTMPAYQIGYTMLGAGLVAAFCWAGRLLNAKLARDAIGRRNPAAAWLACGLMLGLTLAYAGANIGDGPSFLVVLLCAGLSMGGLIAIWAIVELAARVSEHVTIERDVAAGMRMAALFVGGGLILGRAVAGDWVSTPATFRDYAMLAWPALAYAIAEPLVTNVAKATPQTPRPSLATCGVFPAIAYLGWAAGCLAVAGRW